MIVRAFLLFLSPFSGLSPPPTPACVGQARAPAGRLTFFFFASPPRGGSPVRERLATPHTPPPSPDGHSVGQGGSPKPPWRQRRRHRRHATDWSGARVLGAPPSKRAPRPCARMARTGMHRGVVGGGGGCHCRRGAGQVRGCDRSADRGAGGARGTGGAPAKTLGASTSTLVLWRNGKGSGGVWGWVCAYAHGCGDVRDDGGARWRFCQRGGYLRG